MSLGLYLIFGVILVPLYVVVAGWLLGEPRDSKTVALGMSILVALLVAPAVFSIVPIGARLIIP